MQSTFLSVICIAVFLVVTASLQFSGGLPTTSMKEALRLTRRVNSNSIVWRLPDSIGDFEIAGAEVSIAVMAAGGRHVRPSGSMLLISPGHTRVVQSTSDLMFNTNVARPAYVKSHPKVLFDEAHNNPDTLGGRYKPFADLITNDGYRVVPNKAFFSKKTLKGFDVVVIVNASATPGQKDNSAFAAEECDSIRDWVSAGGALLVITDHAPYSAAVTELVKRFGVEVTNGYTVDGSHHNPESDDETELLFVRESGIADHQITNGRDSTERINRIVTFTGTSLMGPDGSVAFLKLSDSAKDVLPPPPDKPKSPDGALPDHTTASAAGRAQGLALEFGRGRVVVVSEAASLTAQVTSRGVRYGMNASGTDNRQLALNVMHWLSRLQR